VNEKLWLEKKSNLESPII